MTLKVTQGHLNYRYSTGVYRFTLMVCSNKVGILHRFRHIITCTVYVTACDLQKSFSFNNTADITSQVYCWFLWRINTVSLSAKCAFWFMWKHIVVSACYISWGMGDRKPSDIKSDLPGHSRWSLKVTGIGAIR